MNKVTSAGGLIVDGQHVLLLQHRNGMYAIPKGHVEPGETIEQAAVREVEEETGMVAEIISYLGELTRLSQENSGEVVKKTIKVYQMRQLRESSMEPDQVSEWVDLDDVVSNMHFQEEAAFLQKHLEALRQTS